MKTHSSGFYIGLIVSLILGFAIVAGIALALRSNATDLGVGPVSAPAVRATITGPGTATLNLATYPDSNVCHPDNSTQQSIWVTYCAGDPITADATRIELPPNSVITVVIKQYDSSTPLINSYFSHVRGTIGDVATLNGKPFSQISPDQPAHTFTIQSVPNSPNPLFVSVPLAGTPSGAPTPVNINGNSYPQPNIITFQFRTGPAGEVYLWHCYDPCGDTQYARNPPFGFSGPMWTLGYMAGYVTVTNY